MNPHQASVIVVLAFCIAFELAIITGVALTWYIQQFIKRR